MIDSLTSRHRNRLRILLTFTCLFLLVADSACLAAPPASTTDQAPANREASETVVSENFARDQLVAWCIVPFDSADRSPQERVEMLERLGLRRVAYDWRDRHVPTFEDEIVAPEQVRRKQLDE